MAADLVTNTSDETEADAERWSAGRLAAAGALSAVLFGLAFPPYSLRPLAWVALVPLLVALRRTTWPRALALACAWGMAAAYTVTDWFPAAVSRYYEQPAWLGWSLFLTASFLMGACDYVAFAAFYRWLARQHTRAIALLAPAAWVVAEMGRSRLLTGNPWGLIGYSQAGLPAPGLAALRPWLAHAAPAALLQVADLGGVYAVSFVIVAVNAALAEVWVGRVETQQHRRSTLPRTRLTRVARTIPEQVTPAPEVHDRRTHPLIAVTTAVVVVAAALVYGNLRMAGIASDPHAFGAPVEIAIVQGNLDLGSQWNSELYGRNLDAYLRLTLQATRAGRPRIVFWPESSMTFFVDAEPSYRRAIARVTALADVELLAGAPRYENEDDPIYYNSAFLLSPSGDVVARYDKHYLLPFAEYFPFSSIAYLKRSFGRVREFRPGTENAPLPTRAGRAGIAICNEAMFPSIVVERARAGIDYLVNLSNDSWVTDAEFAEHQFDLVSLRAVEHHRYLVRASTSGPSGIVDPFGRVAVKTRPFTAAAIRGSIRPRSVDTFYGRMGDLFAWTCLVAVLLRLLAGLAFSRRG